MKKKIVIVGIGNELRGDDGIGKEFIESFDEEGVDKIHLTFPDIDIIERIAQYDVVIFVDASVKTDRFKIREITEGKADPLSHHISLESITQLAKRLYNPNLKSYVVEIQGYDFGFSCQITPQARKNILEAQAHLKEFIKSL